MMQIQWTSKELSDLARLHEFLVLKNAPAAAKAIQAIVNAPETLMEHPRIGERVDEFAPREVRQDIIYMLRVWHTREDR